MNGQTMKTLPEELRPYERLEAFGAEALSDTELLAVLLKSGSRRKTAAEVAADVLCRCGGLSGLDGMSVPALSEVEGIGRAKAVTLLAAYELGLRICRNRRISRIRITDIGQLAERYGAEMTLARQEKFKAVLLDRKWQILKDVTVSVGTVDQTLVHPREVFSEAIANRASAVVVMHNHPAGSGTPSRADEETTRRLIAAGRILGIELADHIIFGNGNYFSFFREGLMEKLRDEIKEL